MDDYQARVRAACSMLVELGTEKIPHSEGTLDQHLLGVWELLTASKYPEHWRLAGLYHSIYTDNGPLSLDDRDRVKGAIGEDAEELVYLYCTQSKPRLDSILANTSGEKRKALVNISVMSALEQGQEPDWDKAREYVSTRAFSVVRPALDQTPIEVFDDLCGDAELINAVWGELNQGKWAYGWRSDHDHPLHRFWNIMILGDRNRDFTPEEGVAFKEEWPAVHRLRGAILETVPFEYRVGRVYSNGYTYGTGGAPHTDDGANTLLYYATPHWKPEWNGETLVFDDNMDIEKAIAYKPGRFVVFDSNRVHQGREVDRLCPALRTIITFKGVRV